MKRMIRSPTSRVVLPTLKNVGPGRGVCRGSRVYELPLHAPTLKLSFPFPSSSLSQVIPTLSQSRRIASTRATAQTGMVQKRGTRSIRGPTVKKAVTADESCACKAYALSQPNSPGQGTVVKQRGGSPNPTIRPPCPALKDGLMAYAEAVALTSTTSLDASGVLLSEGGTNCQNCARLAGQLARIAAPLGECVFATCSSMSVFSCASPAGVPTRCMLTISPFTLEAKVPSSSRK
mmetsp:Transcript_36134/g.58078  ORF Transcript_36134/g.58078 Transcript_36134/m.58078 type:complete len:234 (-) Transcript_36134:4477-5178(-)